MVSKMDVHVNQLVRLPSRDAARAALAADPSLRPLGGGTAVVPALREGAPARRWLVTTSIEGLIGIQREEDGSLHIGAATTLRQIELDERVRDGWPLLAKAISCISGPAIRNVATIGGSLALGQDSPDPAVALMALEARLQVMDIDRDVVISELAPADAAVRSPLIESLRIPASTGHDSDYQRFTVRGAADRPFVSVAVVTMPGRARICAGIGLPRPIDLSHTAQAVASGTDWTPALALDLSELRLSDSERGSSAYRVRVLGALAARAIGVASGSSWAA
jgi:CO/xanthine dehydrogenase FAD-binding subunit